MKKIFVLLSVVALLLTGCSDIDTDIIGTWRGSGMTLEIGKNGKFAWVYGKNSETGTWEGQGTILRLVLKGNYSFGTATLVGSNVELNISSGTYILSR